MNVQKRGAEAQRRLAPPRISPTTGQAFVATRHFAALTGRLPAADGKSCTLIFHLFFIFLSHFHARTHSLTCPHGTQLADSAVLVENPDTRYQDINAYVLIINVSMHYSHSSVTHSPHSPTHSLTHSLTHSSLIHHLIILDHCHSSSAAKPSCQLTSSTHFLLVLRETKGVLPRALSLTQLLGWPV
jgi:hypothetical protein